MGSLQVAVGTITLLRVQVWLTKPAGGTHAVGNIGDVVTLNS